MRINTTVRPRFKAVYAEFTSPQDASRFFDAAKECLKSLEIERRDYLITLHAAGLEEYNRALFFATGYEAALCAKEPT